MQCIFVIDLFRNIDIIYIYIYILLVKLTIEVNHSFL
jgi:hypothetical protein